MAREAFDIRYGLKELGIENSDSELLPAALDVFYAESKVKNYLGKDYLDSSCISGGSKGLTFYKSAVGADKDIINIVASYKAKPYLSIAGFSPFRLENRYYGHAWTGYDYTETIGSFESPEEEYVYKTEWGEVYHRSLDCPHLKLSITCVNLSDIEHKRNEGGAKFYPCEYCNHNNHAGQVYITNYGNRYHTSVSCPGLKRTIYTIPISEVGGLPPCSKCGG
ncbi:MAG: pilus assembly protein [Butyrivibrio sp.]|nr:pilus assembly protein [Butyrivibrio sp.]